MRPKKNKILDYEPVTRSGRARIEEPEAPNLDPFFAGESPRETDGGRQIKNSDSDVLAISSERHTNWLVRRGHIVSFAGIFLFTIAVYLRPYELIPALMPLHTMAFWVALATILVFLPIQLGLEGNLTSRPREVNLLLLLCAAVLLSVPLGDDPANSFNSFFDFLKVVLIFVVMVNVIRTESRWKFLVLLLLLISCFLGVSAVWDYRAGFQLIEGDRVTGSIGNMFKNPNDLALHLVTMVPISVGLFLSTRNPFTKVFYAFCAVFMLAGIMVTQSRGGLVGLVFAGGVLLWKLIPRSRMLALAALLILGGAFVVFAPGGFAGRFSTVLEDGRFSSAGARKDDLKRSIIVTLRHPLFGIGIGNYRFRSNRAVATHNSYTQVSAEAGIAAMVIYIMFLLTPLKRLRALERDTVLDRKKARFHYLAIGMQASLVGYMVCSLFASVAFLWYVYYLVALSVCLYRLYEIEQGIAVKGRTNDRNVAALPDQPRMAVT